MPGVRVYEFCKGDGSTLVGVHAAGGVLFFGKLARMMGNEHSYYAMQGEGLDQANGSHGFDNICDLGSCMADAIQRKALQPPVFLCGRYGTIVLETAQQLLRRKIEVGTLIVIDTVAPAMAGSGGSNGMKRRLLKPVRSVLRIPDNIGLADWIKRNPKSTTDRIIRFHPYMRINAALSKGYQPQRFNGRIILVRSEEFSNRVSKVRHSEGWRQISDNFETYVVPGSHETMFDKPNITVLASLIQDIVSGAGAAELRTTYKIGSHFKPGSP